ncbi:hypothetical protein [Treponema pedis]|uniref:hypothetical protein n=1 Tax=Treponema pedis TaxID=409322 RepID=UPI00042A584E|nr:hypothetical protein [Treponema pedis]
MKKVLPRGRKSKDITNENVSKIVNLLKAHPAGLTGDEIRETLKISSDSMQRALMVAIDEPIACDMDIEDRYYWVGL